ncbi:CAI-1 autoinducer sensor kinase/phosphatase CqsS [Lentibacillus sp. JNUCC-1]|uniref:response regulator transcription factor n=1 Tax=Lentibacillus sp. JNUCC-1 TaxID=2654513 RepID=UPI001328F8FB|nr:CAI-1 autoinducer sensor kinase/phosphatase CqsS [Lentibacillus sp. JNUCC-1]
MLKETILIVDNEESIRDMIQFYLEKKDYTVLTAASGQDGLNLIDLELPDLILLDIEMPGMDGFEVCREIRKKRTLPIIFLSVRRSVMDKVKCFELGGDDYLIKPFDYAELEARIRANLRRYHQRGTQNPNGLFLMNLRFTFPAINVTLTSSLSPSLPKKCKYSFCSPNVRSKSGVPKRYTIMSGDSNPLGTFKLLRFISAIYVESSKQTLQTQNISKQFVDWVMYLHLIDQ